MMMMSASTACGSFVKRDVRHASVSAIVAAVTRLCSSETRSPPTAAMTAPRLSEPEEG